MSGSSLSPWRLGKAREIYNIFTFLNALSYAFLAGNIITLYAMRLNMSSTLIGFLNAMAYWSFFFMPLGSILAKKAPIVKILAATWLIRVLVMISALFAPFLLETHPGTALALIILGVFLFHLFRGVGTIGNNPVLDYMARGPDQASYITFIQVINSGVAMLASFAIAFLLGKDAPIYMYSIIFLVGIILGVAASSFFARLPEPEFEPHEGEKSGFFKTARDVFSDPSVLRFLAIFFIVSFVSAMARAFIVVYSREVFLKSDGLVSLYTVFGGLGALTMGLIIKFFVDRVGSKPLYITCTIVSLLSMLPLLVLNPGIIDSPGGSTFFLTLVHFLISFGFLGAEGVAQTYFFALVPGKDILNLGILYYCVFGLAGSLGSFSGGLILDFLSLFKASPFLSYKILYGALVALMVWALYLERRLKRLGALPFRGALTTMFSFRDLRAINLLGKLKKTSDFDEEEELLEALTEAPSPLAIHELLEKARSPRIIVRIEALEALEAQEELGQEAEKALIGDVSQHPFTTAYLSARILGNHGAAAAIPLLRELINSPDYMLGGESMIALAKLGDEETRPAIEELVLKTENPRLKIMGVCALGIYGSPMSAAPLLQLLRSENTLPFLEDEVVLALSEILDIQSRFYSFLIKYEENPGLGWTLAKDAAEAAYETWAAGKKRKKQRISAAQAKGLSAAIAKYLRENSGALLSAWLHNLPESPGDNIIRLLLAEAVLEDDFNAHEKFRLLVVNWACHKLENWNLGTR
jgi:HEAT repeat protein